MFRPNMKMEIFVNIFTNIVLATRNCSQQLDINKRWVHNTIYIDTLQVIKYSLYL